MAAEAAADELKGSLIRAHQTFVTALDSVLDAHGATSKVNDEQAAEIAVWKQSHVDLSQQISELRLNKQAPKAQHYAVAIVNANILHFNAQLVSTGHAGGETAAVELQSTLQTFLSFNCKHVPILLYLYINQHTWNINLEPKTCSQFLSGFRSINPLWNVLEADEDVHCVSSKAAALCDLFGNQNECSGIFLGGFDYILQDVQQAAVSKLLILEGSELSSLGDDIVKVPVSNVFGQISSPVLSSSASLAASPQASPQRRPIPLIHVPTASVAGRSYSGSLNLSAQKPMTNGNTRTGAVPVNGASKQPALPRQTSSNKSSTNGVVTDKSRFFRNGTGLRAVDPQKPLYKNVPSPCNRFYLTKDGCNNQCSFSHDYKLTRQQLETLAADAKKSPCVYLLSRRSCPQGSEKCHMGHACPDGSQCKFGDKCKFNLPGMHPGRGGAGMAAFMPDDE